MQFRFRLERKRGAYSPGASSSQPNSGRRKKRMAVVRLGGEARKSRFFGALRMRMRLRLRWPWLAAVYRCALRRLRASYEQAMHVPAGVDCAHAASFGPVATVGF